MTAMRLRFTIRDLLLLTALVAVGVAWWVDHRNAANQRNEVVQLVLLYGKQQELMREADRFQIEVQNFGLMMRTSRNPQDTKDRLAKAEADLQNAKSAIKTIQQEVDKLRQKLEPPPF